MIRAIRQEIKVRSDDFLWFFVVTAGAWLLGVSLFAAMIFIFHEEGGWFCLGTITGAVGILIMMMGCGVMQNMGMLDIVLSMSQRRKDYYWANIFVTALEGLAAFALLAVLGFVEKWIFTGIIGMSEEGVWVLPFLIRWAMPVLLSVSVLVSLAGLAAHHFGRMASILFSILFIACCWMPMIMDSSMDAAEGSILSGIGKGVRVLLAWMTEGKAFVLLVLITVAALVTGRVLIRNEAVKG